MISFVVDGLNWKRLVIIASFSALFISPAKAQAEQSPQSTSAAPISRYEIIQSELAARWTFRLDKFCGRVSQLVSVKEDQLVWEDMPIQQRPACSTSARFQVFTSGLAARHTFLLDTSTGKTWQLASSSGVTGWFPLSE